MPTPNDRSRGGSDDASLPGLWTSLGHPGRYNRAVRDRLRARWTDRKGSTAFVLGVAVFLLLGFVGLFVLAFMAPTGGALEQARFAEASVAYTADGKELIRYHDKNRVWVSVDEISPAVIEALIATEDRRFYEHQGVDVRRLLSAVWQTIQGDRQGGSTITMQLARNAFPSIKDDPALLRKYKEWVTALRLEDTFTKEEILEMYLNTVPFLYNAFGIETGARTYFQKSASELGALEAATMVAMLKGTTLYNPVRNPERSRERRNLVLERMVEAGSLPADTLQALQQKETPLDFQRLTYEENLAPYFAEHLRQRLDEWAEANGYNLYTDGLQIYTTLDSRLQKIAEEAVQTVGQDLQYVAGVEWSRSSPPYRSTDMTDYRRFQRNVDDFAYFWSTHPALTERIIQRSGRYRRAVEEGTPEDSVMARLRSDAAFVDSLQNRWERLESAFVAMDPNDGHVKAWVGGRDFSVDQYDHVAQAKRQPGSTFKPFVYAAALENGYGQMSLMKDEVVSYRDPDTGRRWKPENVTSSTGQLMTLRDALAQSKNTVTAQLVMDLGPGRVVDYAQKMGIESELHTYPSIGLGTAEVSLLELVSAYTPIVNQGQYREPVLVTRIENRNGRVIERFSSSSRTALSSYAAYDLLDMMGEVIESGTARRINYIFGAPTDLAAKTGTSQGGVDGWFMLLHPNLIMGSWVGFNTQELAFRSDYWGQGAHNALYVVGNVYQNADLPEADFRQPAGWSPPTPPDSVLFRARLDEGGYYDDYDLDSLLRATDSLLDDSRTERIDREVELPFDTTGQAPRRDRSRDDLRARPDSLGRTGTGLDRPQPGEAQPDTTGVSVGEPPPEPAEPQTEEPEPAAPQPSNDAGPDTINVDMERFREETGRDTTGTGNS